MVDGLDLDAVGQARLVATGEASPLELVDAAIERVERLNPQVNAVVLPRFEQARDQARDGSLPTGPFRGVPMVVKDTALVAGDLCCSGTRALRDAGWRAPADEGFVTTMRAAGLVILGRTNASELGTKGTTEPEAFGPTANPWDVTRSAGGSSGGSAAAVAAGMVAAGHGSDGGGSIRIPAAACGLVGLKASRGRVTVAPRPEPPGGVGVQGWLCRSVRDAAALLDVLAGSAPGDPHALPDPDV